MQDITHTILEYKESGAKLKERIHDINGQLGEALAAGDGVQKRLLERRSILYMELAGIEYAIRELSEYQHAVAAREVTLVG